MLIIPALDISEGKVVRLKQGDFKQKTVYPLDAVEVAVALCEAGATMLHVVDLDAARMGAPQNVELLTRLVDAARAPIQFGGGIRTIHVAEMVLALGVGRVVLGSALTRVESTVRHFFRTLGERCVAGVDARAGKVAVHGWADVTELEALEFCGRLEEMGCPRITFTDIERDGAMQGPNVAALRALCERVSVPVIASGGVACPQDLRNLADLTLVGLEGVIIGRALYETLESPAEAFKEFASWKS
ncbi:MAG: 1-(5-phosphoribosyl)-5-[(5-phosphoribosylamino)methylideneamino] imidazole-4-carboxamide isomerase [Armatimonadota bacterium]